ncbi:ArsR/SmtB family transcription factor [Naasia aerilata]|uniref:ArsR/SmtB family transcription factor n=1 Tax=Naasia aerilata TaxID=1162966 RepID=UPI00257424CB|nr:metalloregulator ArsR/SmtB family transcription factor [Naasia aerilata]
MEEVFPAIADPARRRLVEALAERNDQTLFELCVRLLGSGHSMSRQAVAKHLGVLKAAGLVSTTVQGRTTLHHLDPTALGGVRDWVERIAPPAEEGQQ